MPRRTRRNHIGTVLNRIRNERGLSQVEFATKLKISRGFYSEIETGSKDPSVDTLRTFSRKLNVSADVLLGLV